MIKNAEIEIERFEEGITVRYHDAEGNDPSKKRLAVSGVEYRAIGEEIWVDVLERLNETNKDKVLIKLEYLSV